MDENLKVARPNPLPATGARRIQSQSRASMREQTFHWSADNAECKRGWPHPCASQPSDIHDNTPTTRRHNRRINTLRCHLLRRLDPTWSANEARRGGNGQGHNSVRRLLQPALTIGTSSPCRNLAKPKNPWRKATCNSVATNFGRNICSVSGTRADGMGRGVCAPTCLASSPPPGRLLNALPARS